MYMFEYEWLIEDIKRHNKQVEEQHKKEEKENQGKYNMPNMSQIMSQAQSSMPKISIPKF